MNSTACPSCKVAIKYKDEFAGRKMRCPRCKTVFTLPAAKPARVPAVAQVADLEEVSPPPRRPSKPVRVAAPSPAGKSAKATAAPPAGKPAKGVAPAPAHKSAKVTAPAPAGKSAKVADPIPDELDSRPEEDLDALLAAAQEKQEATAYDEMGSTDETPALPKKGSGKGVGDLAETEEFIAVRDEEEAVIDMIDESLAPAKNKRKKPAADEDLFPDTEEEQAAPVSDPGEIEFPDVDEEELPAPRGKKGKPVVVEEEEEVESPPAIEQEEEAPSRKPVRPTPPPKSPQKKKGGGSGLLLMVLVFVLAVAVGLGGYYLILISSGG
jgi:hypothetical protein